MGTDKNRQMSVMNAGREHLFSRHFDFAGSNAGSAESLYEVWSGCWPLARSIERVA
jgi:hypothetical protein